MLISRKVTVWFKGFMAGKYGYFRLAYNVFSLFTLVPVVYFQFSLAQKVIFAWPWPWTPVKYCMYAMALLLFYAGARVYDLKYMIGIRQMQEMRPGSSQAPMELSTGGIHCYVRHPWYGGAILLVWAFGDITDVSLVSKIILTLYIIAGTLLEEKKLTAEIGEPYRRYRKRVPMFIPWKKGKC